MNGITGDHRRLLEITRDYWTMNGITGDHRRLLEITVNFSPCLCTHWLTIVSASGSTCLCTHPNAEMDHHWSESSSRGESWTRC